MVCSLYKEIGFGTEALPPVDTAAKQVQPRARHAGDHSEPARGLQSYGDRMALCCLLSEVGVAAIQIAMSKGDRLLEPFAAAWAHALLVHHHRRSRCPSRRRRSFGRGPLPTFSSLSD